jgi:hypothetical protein
MGCRYGKVSLGRDGGASREGAECERVGQTRRKWHAGRERGAGRQGKLNRPVKILAGRFSDQLREGFVFRKDGDYACLSSRRFPLDLRHFLDQPLILNAFYRKHRATIANLGIRLSINWATNVPCSRHDRGCAMMTANCSDDQPG